jgi:inosine-uridine nucleoside N-ribohydrolase
LGEPTGRAGKAGTASVGAADSAPQRILLDCDPGHDDAIALLLALASPEVELLGVTTVAGNQTLEKTSANAIRILEFVGRTDVPVAAGADRPLVRAPYVAKYVHGETGLDGPDLPPARGKPVGEHAVDYLARHATGATLVAVGPLTNVALLLARHPDARPERIVLMGGSIGLGNVTPAAEFNIWADPEAAARVFDSGVEVTMIGLDVTHQALMTKADADRLRKTGRVGTLVAELWEFYNRFHSQTYGFDGSPIHDAVALAHVFRPELVETAHRHVAIDCTSELCRGRTVVDLWRRTENEPNAHVGVGIDGRAFIELLLERLSRLD